MADDLTKLDTLLTLAFQESEGPFSVLIKVNGQSNVPVSRDLTKEEILELSKDELITSIELSKRIASRRWRSRSKKNRRGQ
ncbi:MAG TPA: hypothetical protein VM577_18665 [Anaerovoracaceae bacterium]|nr:hypothetical protein [Anaerovoracaceae bacterium]